MIYEEVDPPLDQETRVAAYWSFAIEACDPEAFEHAIVPDGTVSIVCGWIAPAGQAIASFVGPRRTALRLTVHRGSRFWGVRFRPGAAPLSAVADLTERSGPLTIVLPQAHVRLISATHPAVGNDQVFAALRQEVDALSETAPAIDLEIQSAIAHVERARGDVRVATLAAEVGLSPRQFLRRFQTAVGLTPKEYVRMRRLRWACVRAVLGEDSEGWASLAGGSGFADQAHLAREFRRVFGWTPVVTEEYLRRIDHRSVRA